MANRWGNSGNSVRLNFFWAPKSLKMVIAAMKLKEVTTWKESCDQPRQHIEKQRNYYVNKGPSSQGYGFSSGHAWMWEFDYKESWDLKNWWFWTMVLEKTLEHPLDCKEIQAVHPKGNQSWMFTGSTDTEAETPIFWPPDAKSWLNWKDPDAGKDWGQEEKGMIEDEIFGWHHWLNGHEFVWTPWVGNRQGVLTSCGSWANKELDMTEWLNWTEVVEYSFRFLSIVSFCFPWFCFWWEVFFFFLRRYSVLNVVINLNFFPHLYVLVGG